MERRLLVLTAALVCVGSLLALPAEASHSWNGYHWARTANPFTLTVVDSNTSDWDDNLNRALSDWSRSTVMDLTRGRADDCTRARKQCRMVRGQIRSCNAAYGNNGWLGLASINVSGGHITQGTAKASLTSGAVRPPSTGFDCSGLTMYVYAQVGVSLPRYAAAQYRLGVPVSRDQLQPGDLVFYRGLGHMGMYIGGGNYIHAPQTGDVVKISGVYDRSDWVGARRVL